VTRERDHEIAVMRPILEKCASIPHLHGRDSGAGLGCVCVWVGGLTGNHSFAASKNQAGRGGGKSPRN